MADLIPVMDGEVKFRDGKKWKPRYAVVTRLSPVADSLTFQLWKNRKDRELNSSPSKGSLVLEDFVGIETGFTLDRESLTLAIVLKSMVISLAFSNREVLMRWKIRISSQFEIGRSFTGSLVQSSSKLNLVPGPIRIHVQNDAFFITSGVPPTYVHSWRFIHLRRYGNLKENQFVFEGGSQCDRGEGIIILKVASSLDLKNSFDLGAKGKLPGKASLPPSGDSFESRGNSFSSNGSVCTSGLSQFSSSCDTMSEVLSELSNDNYSEHLVNRRSLLERIHSFCERSLDKKKGSFDPTWNMRKEFESSTKDHLISFNDVRYDNPRGVLQGDKILPKKFGEHTNTNVFDNYDIPKTIPTSSLYDVPRSLKNPSRQNDWPSPETTILYENLDPAKIERVRLNGSGRMPVVDMRGGSTLNKHPSNANNLYMNIDPQVDYSHLYENMNPSLGNCQYDTINIKLRKFHDLLSFPKNLESKRKSLSLNSLLDELTLSKGERRLSLS